MTTFQTVLCSTDFSEHADHALEVAIDLAKSLGSSMCVLHVIEPPLVYGPEATSAGLVTELLKVQQDTSQRELSRRLERCRAQGIQVRAELVIGTAALTIIERSKHADIVVVGTRGRTGFKHLFMGSVAERVVRHAHCPVLVVGKDRDQPVHPTTATA